MKKKLISLAIIVMLILVGATISQAATGATATLKVDKATVKPGETFTVTLSITCQDGINGVDTTYSYDKNKLELVSASVKDTASWSSLGTDNQITVICNSTSKITDADVFVLTFKVKDGVVNGTTADISTTDLLVDSDAATDSEKTVKALKTTVTVNTENAGNQQGGTTTKTEEQKPDSTEQKKTSETQQQKPAGTNNVAKDNTKSKLATLPKTGKSGIALITVAVIAIVAVFAYKKYNTYRGI